MRKVILSDVIDIISGGTPKTKMKEYWNGNIGWLSVVDFNNDLRKVYKSEKTITELGLKNSSTKMLDIGDIIISARGTVGALAQIGSPMCFNQSCFGLRGKKDVIINDYLYYALKNYIANMRKRTQGSVFETINIDSFKLMEINIHSDINIQKKIAKVLSRIDDKIELNNKTNSELEKVAKELYDYWFIQFDFPDKNNRPYKSNNGKMVYNEILKKYIPYGWEVKRIKDFCDVITGKEDANFATNNGQYAFFTCGEEILRCAYPQFEGKAILIAGNGNFNVKYFEGKFNAYQRTYVLIPQEKDILGIMYRGAIDSINRFIAGSNGSIVKFITKSDIENTNLLVPNNKNLITIFNKILSKIDCLKKENLKLSSLRDWLLPMLLNGQVKVLD